MEFLVAALTGITIKIYDDISDNKLLVSERYIEFMKTFQVIGLTLISFHDFNFSVSMYILNILSFLGDISAYTTDSFHVSILILYPFLVLLSLPYKSRVNFISILYVLCFIVFFTVEPHIIQEEYSERKAVLRFFTSIVVFVGLFVGYFMGVSTSFLKIGSICLGYIFTSTLFQGYMVSQNNDKILQAMVLYS